MVHRELTLKTKIQPEYLIQLIQQAPQDYRIDGPMRLRVLRKIDDTQERLKLVESLLEEFSRG